MGHTMSIHSQNEQVILEFGLKKPAFRIIVNSPTTHGSIGLTTGLDPAMTLGCGGYGGNITSDNITPRHLLNIKRLAYEITPAANRFERAAEASSVGVSQQRLPAAPPRAAAPTGISAEALTRKIDQFLGSRGFVPGPEVGVGPEWDRSRTGVGPESSRSRTGVQALDFVSEEDVRSALKAGVKLVVTERAIITPAARDLGDQHQVFTIAHWRG
jgi:hypothetical protein